MGAHSGSGGVRARGARLLLQGWVLRRPEGEGVWHGLACRRVCMVHALPLHLLLSACVW